MENTLLKHATRVTVFDKSETVDWFGYQWVSATEIVFQRKGGYVQRNIKTGAEQAVKGCPEQDNVHWFGGNLGASITLDRKPPAVSRVRVTELILGTKVTLGASYVLRFPQRAYASCDAGLSSTGLLLWSLVVRGNRWNGERPLITVIAVSRHGHSGLKELGRLRTAKGDDEDEPSQLSWLPDGKHFSFLYQHGLYIESVD